jgi:hypothetical protein
MNSDMPTASSACLKIVSHMSMWDQANRFKDSTGRVGASGLKDGAVGLQHWTGVMGSSHRCTKATIPSNAKIFLPRMLPMYGCAVIITHVGRRGPPPCL